MLESIRSRLAVGLLTFLATAGVYLAVPEQPKAQGSRCGDNAGKVCWVDESCANFLFYKQCTTRYKYYPYKPPSDGPGTSPSGQTRPVEGGGCMWGRDYLGSPIRNACE